LRAAATLEKMSDFVAAQGSVRTMRRAIMSQPSESREAHGLFDPLTIREITFRNRIAVSPMCQYSCENGLANDWHLVHLGSRAVGGAGLVIAEATAVEARGRISPQDLGIWCEAHIEPLKRIGRFIHSQGAVAGIQLAHAGRKASTARPWDGGGRVDEKQGGWKDVVGPSATPFSPDYPMPVELDKQGIAAVVGAFGEAAGRANQAGYRVVEIHGAHGYLLHSFYSPLSNRRTDAYGGSFENRTRIVREVAESVRRHWPEKYPLFLRISSTDWTEGGWDVEQSVELARSLRPLGVDLIDCSSGGNVAGAKIPMAPGYQAQFAAQVRREAGILTGTVGLITSAVQAEQILRSGQADLVLLARQMLRDPYWPMHAAIELGRNESWPVQYLRAAPPGAAARKAAGKA
jgi:2,4-dienoyl-CoA reductase-like NADH-dependent reductase (Old Yellow Enzyme family)